MALNLLAFDLQAGPGQIQKLIQAAEQGHFVSPVEMAEPGAVDGHHADGTGLLGGTEETVARFSSSRRSSCRRQHMDRTMLGDSSELRKFWK